MDLLKHGESAYPADAWVEQQYMEEDTSNWSPTTKNLSIKSESNGKMGRVGGLMRSLHFILSSKSPKI